MQQKKNNYCSIWNVHNLFQNCKVLTLFELKVVTYRCLTVFNCIKKICSISKQYIVSYKKNIIRFNAIQHNLRVLN